MVEQICDRLDVLQPSSNGGRKRLIAFVTDRPGHDRRYAIDARKINSKLDWHPEQQFESGIRKTVQWFLEHMDWVNDIRSGAYKQWIELNYAERLSL